MLDKAKLKMRIRHSFKWEDDLNRVISLSNDPMLMVEATIVLGNIRLARAIHQRALYG